MITRQLGAGALLLAAAGTTLLAATVVKFDSSQTLVVGEEVAIQGKLQIGEFFGPPGYGEKPEKDRLEKFFYLQLPSPVRIASRTDSKEPDLGLSFIQIIVRDYSKVPLKDKIGRKLELTGKLVASTGPRNHTPFLLEASAVRQLDRFQLDDNPPVQAPQTPQAPQAAASTTPASHP